MSCPDCFSGSVHAGKPRGAETLLYGLKAYVVDPIDRPVKGVVVIIPDAFGWEFVNNRLLADHYADKGDYRVMVPDFMKGGSCPVWLLDTMRVIMNPGNIFSKAYAALWTFYGFVPWVVRQRHAQSFPVVESWFSALRKGPEAMRGAPIFAAGFCWGGKHTVLLAGGQHKDAGGRPLIDAGFTGHPSRLSIPEDIKRMTAPVSFALAEMDHQIKPAQADEIEAIVRAKNPPSSRGEVRTYAGCGHGFAVRADFKKDDVEQQASEAEDQAIAWFNARLK